MSSYATLLDECAKEEIYANETFSSLGSYLESVTNFVNEDVNFEVTISLDEAVSGEIKDKAGKIGATVKRAIASLIAKLEQFREKIADAVKRFVSKAKVTIASKGNEAMKKLLNDNTAKLQKDIKVKEIKHDGKSGKACTDAIFRKAITLGQNVYKNIKDIEDKIAGGVDATAASYKSLEDITALKNDVTTSEVAVDTVVESGTTVVEAYKTFVDDYFTSINLHLGAVQDTCKLARNTAKTLIASLKKAEKEEATSASISIASAYASDVMKISTYTVTYASSILTMATKNSAKIALAAGVNAVKEAPDKAKAAGKKAAENAKAAPGEAKVQAALAKAELKDKLNK